MPHSANPFGVLSTSPSPSSSPVLAASTSSSSTPPREDLFFPPRHHSWADEKEEEIEMEEVAGAAAAAAAVQMYAEADEGESASKGEIEASGEEDAVWQTVGKPKSLQPLFGKSEEWDEGNHASEASEEEEEEEERPGRSQVAETIEEEGVDRSTTASTNDAMLDQENNEQELSNTSIGIEDAEGEKIQAEPVYASADQLTAEAKHIIALSQLDPAIITASLSPIQTSSEPTNMSPTDIEDPQSPTSVDEKGIMVELPSIIIDDEWPAFPAAETWDHFIARMPEVWSAEQVAAAAAAAAASSYTFPPGILSYAAVAAVPASPSTYEKATAYTPSTPSPKESRAASSPPHSTKLTTLPRREVFGKTEDELAMTPDEPVKHSQAAPKETFVRYATQRREAGKAAQEAATATAAEEAAQVSPQDGNTGSTATETSQIVSVPKKQRRSGAAQRKAQKAKKAAAAEAESSSSSQDGDFKMADDASTGTEGIQELMMVDSADESSPWEVAATDPGATTAPPSDSGLQSSASPAEITGRQKSITDFFKKASKVVEQENLKMAVQPEDLQTHQARFTLEPEPKKSKSAKSLEDTESTEVDEPTLEVLTDLRPEESPTPRSLESAEHLEPAPPEEEVPAVKPAKKAMKNRINAQRRAAKKRAREDALEPSVRIRGMDVNAVCLAWVVAAVFAGCTVAGMVSWFIEG
ncbi:hypothetical protein B5807_09785 [Epicoccum nigrum]|uniref:Uncharacterized protein n=1 Tax=Epicoccum nigrum TaxID=105696 RepID=A0A1Y2LVH5_EPING|nr:hypothetical protein B5807_09785 [Epicoccum nigrum]